MSTNTKNNLHFSHLNIENYAIYIYLTKLFSVLTLISIGTRKTDHYNFEINMFPVLLSLVFEFLVSLAFPQIFKIILMMMFFPLKPFNTSLDFNFLTSMAKRTWRILFNLHLSSIRTWVLWPPSFHYIHCSLTASLFSSKKKKKKNQCHITWMIRSLFLPDIALVPLGLNYLWINLWTLEIINWSLLCSSTFFFF